MILTLFSCWCCGDQRNGDCWYVNSIKQYFVRAIYHLKNWARGSSCVSKSYCRLQRPLWSFSQPQDVQGNTSRDTETHHTTGEFSITSNTETGTAAAAKGKGKAGKGKAKASAATGMLSPIFICGQFLKPTSSPGCCDCCCPCRCCFCRRRLCWYVFFPFFKSSSWVRIITSNAAERSSYPCKGYSA